MPNARRASARGQCNLAPLMQEAPIPQVDKEVATAILEGTHQRRTDQ